MECPKCGRVVGAEDRFCNGCGTALTPAEHAEASSAPGAAADATPATGVQHGDSADVWQEEPVWAPTGQVPVTEFDGASGLATSELPATEPIATADPATADLPITEPIAAAGATTTTEQLPATEPIATTTDAQPATIDTSDLPQTEPITEVWMESVPAEPEAAPESAAGPYDFVEREPVAQAPVTSTQPVQTTAMPVVSPIAPPRRFRFSLILFVSFVTGVVALVGLFANVVVITSDVRLVATPDTPPDFRTGTWIVDDLAGNVSLAGLIAVAAMIAGGIASGFGWRWGSGLAGGAGLSIAGIAALVAGLAQFPIDTARAFARVPSEDPFVLTITRDLGFWLLIAAGALGVVLFFASSNDAFGDRRSGLNPWIAALGGLAVVVTAAGPLLPERQAVFSDNWYLIEGPGEAPALLLVGRLVQLGLFLIGGVVGFLSVRRWGLGVALGVGLPALWLVVSTLFEITDDPVGLGFRNPGAVDMHVHGVTIIGASGVLAMLILAVVGAYDQAVRDGY